jgi:hypothetical protein
MLKVMDCGCSEHKSCQATFTGNKAVMMERFIVNLPRCDGYYTYICEYGHTHRIVSYRSPQKIAISHVHEEGVGRGVS